MIASAKARGASLLFFTANDGGTGREVWVLDLPIANDDGYVINEDTPLVGNVLDNDNHPGGDPMTVVWMDGPAHGVLATDDNGSFTYTPELNYFGNDTFTYKLTDGLFDSALATVVITVDSINDVPAITEADVGLAPSEIVENDSVTLTGSFTDPDLGDAHTVVIDWGDLSSQTTLPLAAGVFDFTTTHQYLDDTQPAIRSA